MLPRRVRLSDSAVGLTVAMGITTQDRGTWWPADFDSNGQVRADRGHIGEAFLVVENGTIKWPKSASRTATAYCCVSQT